MALKSGLWIMEAGWMDWMGDLSMNLDENFRTFLKDCQKLLMQYHGSPLLSEPVRWRVGTFLSSQVDRPIYGFVQYGGGPAIAC